MDHEAYLVLAKEVGASLSVGADILKRRLVPLESVGVDQLKGRLVPSGSVGVDQLKRRLVPSRSVGADQLKRRLVPSGSVSVDQFIKEACCLQNQLVLVNQSVGALKVNWC
jgi:hypothetical protein